MDADKSTVWDIILLKKCVQLKSVDIFDIVMQMKYNLE